MSVTISKQYESIDDTIDAVSKYLKTAAKENEFLYFCQIF